MIAPEFRLLYLRHGETDLNKEGRMQGVPGVPLNELGRRQLARAADRLVGEGVGRIYASDLDRAVESAEIVAGRLGLPVTIEPRLREHDLGEWEGEPWLELPPEERDAYIADLDFAPPGGETNREVLTRVTEFREEIRAAHPGETVLIVSHGGPLFALMHDVLELPWTPRQRFYPTNGGISEFAWWNGGWKLITFDETHHLRGLP